MPAVYLHELRKYYERVQAILASDLTEFRTSGARGTINSLRCTVLSSSQIPSWLDHYINSVGINLVLFDSAGLYTVMAYHIKSKANEVNCQCASIPQQTIRDFWEALASVVDGSFEKVKMIDV